MWGQDARTVLLFLEICYQEINSHNENNNCGDPEHPNHKEKAIRSGIKFQNFSFLFHSLIKHRLIIQPRVKSPTLKPNIW